jgi:hypothetical protein
MTRVAHIIGNGDMASMYKPVKGIKMTCNLPPFEINNVYATGVVDFKMCKAIDEGSVELPSQWVCGYRPKVYCDKNPNFYMRYATKIKEFYTLLPPYTKVNANDNHGNMYTNFNCGHFVTHYTAARLKAEEIHLYGFDSIFDFTVRSFTDLVLNSDRGQNNNNRLINNWRPIWLGIFNEFSDRQFILYHKHANLKITLPENVEVRTKN